MVVILGIQHQFEIAQFKFGEATVVSGLWILNGKTEYVTVECQRSRHVENRQQGSETAGIQGHWHLLERGRFD